MNLNRVPVRQWKHREFEGVDPWAGGRPVRWSIVTFRIVAEWAVSRTVQDQQMVRSESNGIPKKYAIGLYGETTGRYRILPSALARVWREGRVPDHDLPGLLYQEETALRRKNDTPGPLSGWALSQALAIGATALAIFGYYLYMLTLSSEGLRG